jgi:hypothetical protein
MADKRKKKEKTEFLKTLATSFAPELTYTGAVDNDFEREAAL